MTYSVLIFDLDDTLLDFQAGEKKGLEVVFNEFSNGTIPYEEWFLSYKEVNRLTWQAIEQGADVQSLLNQRFAKTFSLYNQLVDGPLAESIYRNVLDTNYAILPGAKDLMDELSTKGFHIIAGTNGKTNTQYQRLTHSDFERYFEHIVISGEIGHAKPSTSFYNHIFALYPDLSKDQFLMIGDTFGSDVLGAKHSGIDSIWFNPSMKEKPTEDEPTFVAKDFDAIRYFLNDSLKEKSLQTQ